MEVTDEFANPLPVAAVLIAGPKHVTWATTRRRLML
jgi:hypothetical protein